MSIPFYAIVAAAQNRVIGCRGAMPWHLSTDLKRFKTLTKNKPIIMGRKTWGSIGRPLPSRSNIVISRDARVLEQRHQENAQRGLLKEHAFEDGPFFVSTIEEAKALAQSHAALRSADSAFVIGGGLLYKEMLPFVEKIFFTRVLASPEGDAYFPELEPHKWCAGPIEFVPAGEKDSFATEFFILERC